MLLIVVKLMMRYHTAAQCPHPNPGIIPYLVMCLSVASVLPACYSVAVALHEHRALPILMFAHTL